MPIVNNTSSRRIGILSDFAEIYKNRYPVYASRQDKFIKRGTVKTRIAEYALKESIPVPEFWEYNEPRTRKTLKDRYLTVYHYPFQLALPYNRWDEEDDVLGDLRSHLESMTNRFLQIPDIMVSDYLNNAATMQPTLSTAFDGVALASATDGDGNDRFGITGGNIVTSTGVGTVAAILHDLWTCQTRWLQFLDTEGQPFFSPEEVAIDKVTCVVPSHLLEVFQNAREAKMAYVNPAINTAQENVLAMKFDLWVNPRLSTSANTWFAIIDHSYLKPFFYVLRNDLETLVEDETNDHNARNLGQRAILGHLRSGMCPFAPQSIIQVSA